MGLNFTDTEVPTLNGVSLQAQDSATGKTVSVKVSSEFIQDHGLGKAKQIAQTKYDSGQIEGDGSVSVRTVDSMPTRPNRLMKKSRRYPF